ncbi:hypothetical protein WDM22_41315 [Bradyrhizobium septentrionale]
MPLPLEMRFCFTMSNSASHVVPHAGVHDDASPALGFAGRRASRPECELTMRAAPRKSSRIELRMLAEAEKPARRRRLSATQKVALQEALAGRLQLYPRGYAARKTGPFHSRRAILGLVRAGLMSLSATARYAAVTKRAREIHADPTADGVVQGAMSSD